MEPKDQTNTIGGVDRSMLHDLVDSQMQTATGQATVKIEDIVTTIVTQTIKQHQALQFHGLPATAYVDVDYPMSGAAIVYMNQRLKEVFGPTVTITHYLHHSDPHHVVYQLKA